MTSTPRIQRRSPPCRSRIAHATSAGAATKNHTVSGESAYAKPIATPVATAAIVRPRDALVVTSIG